jgi:hypothetical protein
MGTDRVGQHQYERSVKTSAKDVIDYEIVMMEHCATRVLHHPPDVSDRDQLVCLEAFLLHFRVLLEFFGKPDRRHKDNLYFQRPQTYAAYPSEEAIEAASRHAANLEAKWGQRLNKFLAHPTERRYTTRRSWPVEEMRMEMRTLVNYWHNCWRE